MIARYFKQKGVLMDDHSRSLLAIAASGFEPPNSDLFLHVDGGLYRLWGQVKSADTGEPLVLYEHLYPFEPGFWTRSLDQFQLRFARVDAKWAQHVQDIPAHKLRQIVDEHRARRRAAEAQALVQSRPAIPQYALGFMCTPDRTRVALIRRLTPAWQAGCLYGIGGKIEDGETPIQAMARSFTEKTGVLTESLQWEPFAHLTDPAFEVHAFRMVSDQIDSCQSQTAEHVEVMPVDLNLFLREGISGLAALVRCALNPDVPFLRISYRAWAEHECVARWSPFYAGSLDALPSGAPSLHTLR